MTITPDITADRISFRSLVVPIITFLLGMFVLVLVFSTISNQRKQKVYQTYAAETKQYIEKNRQGLVKIFTEVFPKKDACYYNKQTPCPYINGDLTKYISSDIKDFSSMMFIRKDSTGAIQHLRLSGELAYFYGKYETEQRVLDLLNGTVESIPWDDYTYSFPQKELVMPVKDDKGKVVGAIVRGILEK